MRITRLIVTAAIFISPLTAQDRALTGDLHVFLPGTTSAVSVGLAGYQLQSNTMNRGRRYIPAKNPETGAMLSVTLEHAGPGTHGCRPVLEARLSQAAPFEKRGAKIEERGDVTTLEYLISEVQGRKIEQRNWFACMVRGGFFVDLHVSKVQAAAGDERTFKEALSSLRLIPYAGNDSMEGFILGSQAFQSAQYPKAIEWYGKALALEKQNRRLDQTFCRVLIDNLGMAQGITGDIKSSRETFEYGLTLDPEYPLFYYNLACGYGEQDDATNALKNLRKAYEYKANVVPGEKIPDPSTDSSFARLMNRPDFAKAVRSLVHSSK